MQAKVISITESGIKVMVRRNYRAESLDRKSLGSVSLRVGDRIECHRRPNNPYVQYGPAPSPK